MKTNLMCVLVLAALEAHAEVPTVGLVHNTKETSAMTYRCQPVTSEILECEFAQSAVRPVLNASGLGERLKSAKDEFAKGVNVSDSECSNYRQFRDIFEGRLKAPKEEGLKKLSEIEKGDALQIARAFVSFCASKTEANYLEIVRVAHERDMRTCNVSSYTFMQTFRIAQNAGEGPKPWIVKAEPKGECGIVDLSRFEPEKQGGKRVFWKYIARKAVTNPTGKTIFGQSCKMWDEAEYLYDWRSKDTSLRCDYIRFSPL